MIILQVLKRVSAVSRPPAALEGFNTPVPPHSDPEPSPALQPPAVLHGGLGPHVPQLQALDAGAQSRSRQNLRSSAAPFVPRHLWKHKAAVVVFATVTIFAAVAVFAAPSVAPISCRWPSSSP